MLVDPLTKYSGYVSKSLFQLLTSGTWTIAGEIRVRHHFGGKTPKKVSFDSELKELKDNSLCLPAQS